MPESIQAYICNLGLHWFTIRRFGRQHFDLNSMYYAPRLLHYRELEMYLSIIQENGYSVFIVNGPLPDCLADQQLLANPIGEAEYKLLIKDLPEYIVDGKTMTGPTDRNKGGRMTVQLPKQLYEEFQKDPNNPRIRDMINAQLPKGLRVTEIADNSSCSNPKHNHPRGQLVIATMPDDIDDEESTRVCYCGQHHPPSREQHHPQSRGQPRQYTEQVIDDGNINSPNERHGEPQVVARQITQFLISKPDPNDSNASSQSQVIPTPQITIINQTSNRNNPPIDNRNIQQRVRPDIDDDEDFFLNEAIARSLSTKPPTDVETELSIMDKRLEMLDQEILDKTIADSLLTNDLHTRQIEQTPELIPIKNVDTPSTQPEVIKMPSSPPPTDTHSSPPVVNVDKSPSTYTNSRPSTNVHISSSTNTSLPSSTNTHSESRTNTPSSPPTSPAATNSPPSTVDDSHFVVSPTIEGKLFKIKLHSKIFILSIFF